MDKIGAARDQLATAQGYGAQRFISAATLALASLMKNGRCPGNRIAALRHFQPLDLFNSGVL
jgi:hypothetical protein